MGSIAIAIVALCLPAGAGAEYFVPPGNSAATQYTEAVPTARGDRDSERRRRADRSPTEILGERNARRLREQGADGGEVAEVVATTAPLPDTEPPAQPRAKAREGATDDSGSGPGREGATEEDDGSAGGGGAGAGPSGSSGLSEVLSQATGVSSSGQLGPLLPLMILATAAWALAFALRRRRRATS